MAEGARRLDVLAWAATALAVSVLVSWTGMSVGVAWAENDYLAHLDAIRAWMQEWMAATSAEQARIATEQAWKDRLYWNPHPPFYKWMALVTQAVFGPLGFVASARVPSALMFGAAVAVLGYQVSQHHGRTTGIVAAVILACMPRAWGHAQLFTTESTLLACWLMGSLAHARWLQTRSWAAWAAMAACLSVAWCTKFTGILLGIPWGILTLVELRGVRDIGRALLALAGTLVPAVLLLVLCYPLLWSDPLGELRAMLALVARWNSTNQFIALYLGEVVRHTELPWHFPFVILGITVPSLLLLLATWGLFVAPRGGLANLCRVQVGFWIVLFVAGLAPRYDNERQLLPILPFLAVLAALGAADLRARAEKKGMEIARRAVAPVVMSYAVATMAVCLPFPLSYFSEAIGGVAGATRAGFEATYLMEVVTRPLLNEWTADLPPNAGLSVRPASDLGTFYQARGWLRPDLRLNKEGPFVLVVWRAQGAGFVSDLENAVVLHELQLGGVPLATLFFRPGT